MTTPAPQPNERRRSTATLLVEIAETSWTFGCTSSGDTWAAPANAPDLQRPLAEIRPELAAVFSAEHGHAPNATALGDAMTVLEGRARRSPPTEATVPLRCHSGR
jgi:hypothetical protein